MPLPPRSVWIRGLTLFGGVCAGLVVHAQSQIYRCGNEYTNNPGDAERRGCKPIDGGNLTIVQGNKPPEAGVGSSNRPSSPNPGATASRSPSSVEQQARDRDARAILGGELRRAEQRLKDLKAEYNNGDPEKQGIEFRNHQRYLDRVEKLKTDMARAESDVTSLKRELERMGPPR